MKTNDELIQDFFNAVLRKNISELTILVEQGVDINSKDKRGNKGTALHDAVNWLNFELAQWLIDHHADLEATDEYGCTPLHKAVLSTFNGYDGTQKQKRIEMVQLLINHGANIQTKSTDGWTLLYSAATRGFEMFTYILNRCNVADINVKNNDGETPLHRAVGENDIEMVKLLIEKGADVTVINNQDQTLLHRVSGYRREVVALIKYLVLECHLDIHQKDKMGRTPLHYAAQTGLVDTVKFLISEGASIDETDNEGQTALHLVVRECDDKNRVKERLELLISNGAKNDKKDKQGQTPLHRAVLEGLSDTVRSLLDTNIGIDIKDNHGLTAAMYAEFRFKLRKTTSEIYEFFESIQDLQMKESLLQSIPKLYFYSYSDYSPCRSFSELQEMFGLFKNTEKVQCDEMQSNQWPLLFANHGNDSSLLSHAPLTLNY